MEGNTTFTITLETFQHLTVLIISGKDKFGILSKKMKGNSGNYLSPIRKFKTPLKFLTTSTPHFSSSFLL